MKRRNLCTPYACLRVSEARNAVYLYFYLSVQREQPVDWANLQMLNFILQFKSVNQHV